MSELFDRKILALVIAVFAVSLIACGSGTGDSSGGAVPSSGPEISDDPDVGVRSTILQGFYWQPDDAEASRRADLVVVAKVDEPGEPFWSTVSGERPGVSVEGELASVPKDQLRWGSLPQIYTPWTFTVSQTLKGEHHGPGPITVNWLGGEIPPDSLVQEGEIAFFPGNDVVLFLKDCGQAREDKYGTRYQFVKRSLITSKGLVTAYVNDRLISLDQLLETVAEEKDLPAEHPITCA